MTTSFDAVFKALADPARRRLLDKLFEHDGQTLGALCTHLDMTRQAVSKHLAVLEDANLVAVLWHGREKRHYLNPVPIHRIGERWIRKFERKHLDALGDLKRRLEGASDVLNRVSSTSPTPRRCGRGADRPAFIRQYCRCMSQQ